MAKKAKTGRLLKRAEDIHFAEVGSEFYVTLETRDLVACLNPAAFSVVENLDGFSRAEDIAKALATRCSNRSTVVQTAVKDVCAQLTKVGLLEEVDQVSAAKRGPFDFAAHLDLSEPPAVLRVWQGKELAGGLFVNSEDCDIHVIVPNVTDGPIKTCPPHTCTIPAGLFTANTIIRTFNEDWQKNFQRFRRSGLVHRDRRRR
jgi:hypothetical protein